MYKILGTAREQLRDLEAFVSIAAHALHMATKRKEMEDLGRRITKALGETEKEVTADNAERAERIEAFAKGQAAGGLPYLFDLASVRLWGILEERHSRASGVWRSR